MQFNPDVDFKLLLATPLIPLTLYVVQIFFGRHLPRKGDWLLTGGMGVVMIITLWMAAKAIYAGYTDNQLGTDAYDLTRTDRSFFLKLGYAWLR